MTTLEEASIHVHLHTIGVHTMLCVLFALLTAGSNACAAVLQRKAAAQVPPERSMHVSLIADLIKRRVWLAGIGMVIVAAVAQAAALATGPIALVQPIFIIELPVTLVLAALANHNRAALRRLPWTAIIAHHRRARRRARDRPAKRRHRLRAEYELGHRAHRHRDLRGRADHARPRAPGASRGRRCSGLPPPAATR